ncbi:MAG: hypothetical protein V4808_15940 [Pseudomonadota bacterium]
MRFREIAAIPVALVSIFFLFLAIGGFFLLPGQAAKDRQALTQLKVAAEYAMRFEAANRRLPDSEQLQAWAKAQGIDMQSISTSPLGCLNDFMKPRDDAVLVGYWAGEWAECYAAPSGATTLAPSVWALLMSGLALTLASYLAIGLLAGLAAWWIGFRRRVA